MLIGLLFLLFFFILPFSSMEQGLQREGPQLRCRGRRTIALPASWHPHTLPGRGHAATARHRSRGLRGFPFARALTYHGNQLTSACSSTQDLEVAKGYGQKMVLCVKEDGMHIIVSELLKATEHPSPTFRVSALTLLGK